MLYLKIFGKSRSQRFFSLMFYSRNCIAFTSIFIIPIFIFHARYRSKFSFFVCWCPIVPAPLVRRLSFVYWIALHLGKKYQFSSHVWVYFWISTLLHWSVCLSTCQHHTIGWCQFSSLQSLSCVWLFVTPWIVALQASRSTANSQSLLKLMSIKLVMPSNHLILCCFLLLLKSFPASVSFQMSQLFSSGGQSIGVSGLTSVLPMNIQDWSPLGWTGWISL